MADFNIPEDLIVQMEPVRAYEPLLLEFMDVNQASLHHSRDSLGDPFVFRSDFEAHYNTRARLEARIPILALDGSSRLGLPSQLVNHAGRGRGGRGHGPRRGGGYGGGGGGRGGHGDGDDEEDDADDDDTDDDDTEEDDAEEGGIYIDPSISLDGVGGLDEHVDYVRRAIIYPMTHIQAMKEWGMEPPKGIMFHGPPGTGKTLLAKAIANEVSKLQDIKVSFYYHKGGESFSRYLGESSAKLRKLFETAVRNKPSIIFFDEIDGLCPNRDESARCAQAYVSVLTSMLGLLDGVKRGDVFIIAATNRLDSLDPAVRRPGRFDHDLFFPLPNDVARTRIVQIHTGKWPRDKPEGTVMEGIVKRTRGFTGADLGKLCSDAARAADARCRALGIDQTNVAEEDWIKAYSEMTRSSIDVFGSTLHVATPLPAAFLPLLGNTIDTAAKSLTSCLDQGLLTPGQLLLWDPVNSDEFHLSSVVQGILSRDSFTGASVFVLDDVVLRRKVEAGPVNFLQAMRQTVEQVINSRAPAILLIPAINIFHAEYTRWEASGSSFLSELRNIRGRDKAILATWLGSLEGQDDDPTQALLAFFDKCEMIQMTRPSQQERNAFFAQLDLSTAELEKAVQITDEDGVHDITTLFQQLGAAHPSKAKIKDVLGKYQQM